MEITPYQIAKTAVKKDKLDDFLRKMDDPSYGRTIYDPTTQEEIVLTNEDIELVKRVQAGKLGDGQSDPYEDYIDFVTFEKVRLL